MHKYGKSDAEREEDERRAREEELDRKVAEREAERRRVEEEKRKEKKERAEREALERERAREAWLSEERERKEREELEKREREVFKRMYEERVRRERAEAGVLSVDTIALGEHEKEYAVFEAKAKAREPVPYSAIPWPFHDGRLLIPSSVRFLGLGFGVQSSGFGCRVSQAGGKRNGIKGH